MNEEEKLLKEKIELCEKEILDYMEHLTKVLHYPKRLRIKVLKATETDLTPTVTKILMCSNMQELEEIKKIKEQKKK